MDPQVTITIPVFRRTTYFRQALDSALAQTVPVKILVHDASPGDAGFKELIGRDSDRVQYFHFTEDRGMAGNWNRCLELAQTKWVCMLHDDDLLTPKAVEWLVGAQERHPGPGLYFGLESVLDETGTVRQWKNDLVDDQIVEIRPQEFVLANPTCAVGIMLNRETVLSLGAFNTRLKMTPDWDLWIRLTLHSGAVRVNAVTGQYRHYFSLNRGTSIQELDGTKLVRAKVQLKRNLARIQAKDPEFMRPPDLGYDLHRSARMELGAFGYRLSAKGRRIYLAYAVKGLLGDKKKASPPAKLAAILFCWCYLGYSYVPYSAYLSRFIAPFMRPLISWAVRS